MLTLWKNKFPRWVDQRSITGRILKPVERRLARMQKLTADPNKRRNGANSGARTMRTTSGMGNEEGLGKTYHTQKTVSDTNRQAKTGEANQTREETVMREAETFNPHRFFKTSEEVMREAYENIRKYQSGEVLPAKTGYDYLDEAMLGGFRPGQAIVIGARPAVGKSYVAQKIVETVMNPSINPQASEYLLVNCEFEMNPQDLLVRRMSREMKRGAADILRRHEVKEAEEKWMRNIVDREIRKNIIYVDSPCTAKEFEMAVDHIANKNRHKRMIIFKIDHIALIKRIGMDPKSVIDDTVAVMNEAKLKYKNVFFFIISQFNREIEGRLKSKLEQAPRQSDFYQSDSLGQLCSVMIGLHNPRRYGLQEYMTFNKAWYPSLDRFKTVNKTSFRTEGLLFHHVLKTRGVSLEELTHTIYPEIMPGWGGRYFEGEATFINPEQPPLPPREYNEEEEMTNPY